MPRNACPVLTGPNADRLAVSDDMSTPFTLAAADPGRDYHVTSLGDTRHARLELLAAGLSPDGILTLLRGEGSRPRIVACGDIRAAIGIDLATRILVKPCGCGCGCTGEAK